MPKKVLNKSMNLDDMSVIIGASGDSNSKVFRTAELPHDIRKKLMLHGLMQKLGDSVSAKGPKNGYTEVEMLDIIGKTWEALKSNNWAVRIAGPTLSRDNLMRAYCALIVSGIGYEKAREITSQPVFPPFDANAAQEWLANNPL